MMRPRHNDVTVEFCPLGSGHRLMLEYDLIMPSPAKLPSLAHLYSEKNKLRDILFAWNDSVQKFIFPTLLAYICDSHYTSQSLSLNVLQKEDRLRATCLKDPCSQIGMGLYIADLNRTRSGICDYYPGSDNEDDHHVIEIEDDDEIVLTEVVDLDGNTVAGGISIKEEEHLVQGEFDDILGALSRTIGGKR